MKPANDSAECLDRGVPRTGSGSNFRRVLIIVCVIFLPLGIFHSVSTAQGKSISSRDHSAYSSRSRTFPILFRAPVPKQGTSKLKGYVYKTDGKLLPAMTITFKNRATGISETYHTGGKFTIPLKNGSYDVRIRDGKGHISRYSDIVIDSDTSIKFSFGSFVEPITPIIGPTPDPSPPKPDPSPVITPDPDNNDNRDGGSGGDGRNDGGNKNDRDSDRGKNESDSADPDDENGITDPDEDAEESAEQNSNSAANDDIKSFKGNTAREGDSRPETENGFVSKLTSFVTENPVKIALTVLAALAVAALAVFGIPAGISAFAGSLLGGLGLAGKTDETDDDVRCTLYSAPEVREGSDLLVQVFAHLPEQTDGLDELAGMLDPEAKKQLSKSLKQRIKRDSVLTFKLMIPGIEFEEDEQDLVWRGEPDSVEFIVPVPADHGDGNRFGRVFVYQNGDELGKIPFRITVVSKAKPLAVEKIEPGVQGVMTQNETAFVSYASKDKDHVYRFVQLMDVLKYKYHIDVFSIEAGDRWENKLYEFIDTDDVFLLFWSESASQSEWVLREAKRAEERAKSDPNSLPRIIIYRLDEKVSIPEWLQQFHVDRKWAGMIANIKEKSAAGGGVTLP